MKNNLYDFYSNFYELENLNIKISDKQLLFLVYDDKYNYYNCNSCYFDTDSCENILETISDYTKRLKIQITNFYPVCYCGKTLVIAFRSNVDSNSNIKIVDINEMNDNFKELIEYHKQKFITMFVSSNVNKEISMSQKYINRYKWHEKFIKKYILTDKKRKKDEFKTLLNKLIPNKKSIIDVSCGDSSDVFLIAKEKNYDTIVGNDICLNYLRTQNDNDVFLTNDNIEQNFIAKDSYDVSYCKNTLHHMNNLVSINDMLSFLKKISKVIILIEIINPKETGGFPKFLNKYLYTKFLKDVGNCYLNENQFKNIVDNNFDNCDIQYKKFSNVLGEYMVAKIIKNREV